MKLNYRRTVLVGLAFMTISAFWQLYDFEIPLILKNNFNLNDGIAGFIMSIDNILALFMLPLFGVLSDRTGTRIGRRMPYIVFGTATAVASMLLLPYFARGGNLVFFMAILGVVLVAMATYRSPAVALMPDVTPKPLRSRGNAVINLMGALGGILTLGLISLLAPDAENPATADYYPVFLAVAVLMAAGIAAVFFTVREPEWVKKMRSDSAALGIDAEEARQTGEEQTTAEKLSPEVFRSMALILVSIALWFMGYNAVTTAFSKYATLELAMKQSQAATILLVANAGAIVSYLPVGIIATKIGRRKSILFGVVLLALVFGTAALYTSYSPLMYVLFALAGVAWAAINVNSLPMVLEMSKGASIGKYTGYYYTFSMAAQIATPTISGLLLEYVGYWTLLPYAAVFVALAFVTMFFVRHGDSKPVPSASKLETFNSPD